MSASDENELFNPKDFDSITMRVYFKNLTMDKTIKDPSKISIIEVGDNSLTISLPANYAPAESHVQFQIFWYDCDKDTEEEIFHATGKVTETGDSGEGTSLAAIRLIQYDKKSWGDFLWIFSRRQEEITKFFEAGKK